MAKLKLGPLLDEKPIKIAMELPATVHRDLVAYAEALSLQTGQKIDDPCRLIPLMLERFMVSDRAFSRASRKSNHA